MCNLWILNDVARDRVSLETGDAHQSTHANVLHICSLLKRTVLSNVFSFFSSEQISADNTIDHSAWLRRTNKVGGWDTLPFCPRSKTNIDSRWVLQQARLHCLNLQFTTVFVYDMVIVSAFWQRHRLLSWWILGNIQHMTLQRLQFPPTVIVTVNSIDGHWI